MATPAYLYLSIFDGVTGRALWLGRTKHRLTRPKNRAPRQDRGCTHPGCDMPWLPLRSPPCRRLGPRRTHRHRQPHLRLPPPQTPRQGWRTTKLTNGQTQWTPPPQLPFPTPPTIFHHPERFFDHGPRSANPTREGLSVRTFLIAVLAPVRTLRRRPGERGLLTFASCRPGEDQSGCSSRLPQCGQRPPVELVIFSRAIVATVSPDRAGVELPPLPTAR